MDGAPLFDRMGLLEVTRETYTVAEPIERHVKSLDALHLATALLSGVASLTDKGISVQTYGGRANFMTIRKMSPKHATFLERHFVKIGLVIAFFGVIVPVTVALIHDAM